jgi:hypothetical protein
MSLKSCRSTLSSSHVDRVTTVLSRGKSCRIESPNVAPTPKLHNVTGVWKTETTEQISWNFNALDFGFDGR